MHICVTQFSVTVRWRELRESLLHFPRRIEWKIFSVGNNSIWCYFDRINQRIVENRGKVQFDLALGRWFNPFEDLNHRVVSSVRHNVIILKKHGAIAGDIKYPASYSTKPAIFFSERVSKFFVIPHLAPIAVSICDC